MTHPEHICRFNDSPQTCECYDEGYKQTLAEERERVVGVDKTCTIAEHIPSEEGEVCECGYFRKSKGYDYCRYVRDKVSDFRNFKDDLKQIVIEDVPHQYQERLLDLAKVFPSREPPHIEKQVHIENLISKAIAEERERVMKILSAENYKLEEWYSSSERPDTLTHFEANQRNMKTRNKIQDLLSSLGKPFIDKE